MLIKKVITTLTFLALTHSVSFAQDATNASKKYGFDHLQYEKYIYGNSENKGHKCELITPKLSSKFVKCSTIETLSSYAGSHDYEACKTNDTEFIIFKSKAECQLNYKAMIKKYDKNHLGKYMYDQSNSEASCKIVKQADISGFSRCMQIKNLRSASGKLDYYRCFDQQQKPNYFIFSSENDCNEDLQSTNNQIRK